MVGDLQTSVGRRSLPRAGLADRVDGGDQDVGVAFIWVLLESLSEQARLTDIIEHVDPAANFMVFWDGARIGAGHHVDFTVDPDGFTNVPVAADPELQIASANASRDGRRK